MRISDWSSDVCSSDLSGDEHRLRAVPGFGCREGRQEGAQRRDRAERRADRLRLADAGGALVDLVGAASAAPARSVSPGSITPALPETRRQFAAWGRGELAPG